MGYLRKEIISQCKDTLTDVSNFYKAVFINYRGRTRDTAEYYTEVIAEYLCDHIEVLEGIREIVREASYRTIGHDGNCSSTSNRLEEKIAMEMYKQCQVGLIFDGIGKIIDYQVPLKNKKRDVAGKIDLLSVKGDTLYILELKRGDSDETMLRCVLEGYTYLRTVNIKKLLSDYELTGIKRIYASPLVYRGMSQWKEMREERPQLFRLMGMLQCKPFYIRKEEEKYIVTED